MADIITDAQKAEWVQRLDNARQAMGAKWGEVLEQYNLLKYGREQLGVPLTDASTWTPADHQKLLDYQAMAEIAQGAILDALDGKRKLGLDPQLGIAEIEALPTDPMLISYKAGQGLLLVDQQGNPVQATGQLGLAPLVAALIVVGIAALTAAIWKYENTQQMIKELDVQKTKLQNAVQIDLQKQCADLVASGKYTPEQCLAQITQIQRGQAAIIQANADEKRAEQVNNPSITSTINTGLYVVGIVALAGIGLAAYKAFVPQK
jgi:hypothetical protein